VVQNILYLNNTKKTALVRIHGDSGRADTLHSCTVCTLPSHFFPLRLFFMGFTTTWVQPLIMLHNFLVVSSV